MFSSFFCTIHLTGHGKFYAHAVRPPRARSAPTLISSCFLSLFRKRSRLDQHPSTPLYAVTSSPLSRLLAPRTLRFPVSSLFHPLCFFFRVTLGHEEVPWIASSKIQHLAPPMRLPPFPSLWSRPSLVSVAPSKRSSRCESVRVIVLPAALLQ